MDIRPERPKAPSPIVARLAGSSMLWRASQRANVKALMLVVCSGTTTCPFSSGSIQQVKALSLTTQPLGIWSEEKVTRVASNARSPMLLVLGERATEASEAQPMKTDFSMDLTAVWERSMESKPVFRKAPSRILTRAAGSSMLWRRVFAKASSPMVLVLGERMTEVSEMQYQNAL